MKKALLVLSLVVVAVVTLWKLRGHHDVAPSDDSLLLDRVWLDHMPRNDRDTINAFLAITDQPLGIFQAASQWKGNYELFRYEASGDEMRLVFPQNGDREKVTAKARRCNERGMDYCLELDGSKRGVKRYYSRKGWEIDGNHMQDRIETMLRSLPSED